MRQRLPGWISPEVVARRLAGTGDVVWIDAGVDADRAGGRPRDGHPGRSLLGWGSERVTADAAVPGAVADALSALDASLRGRAAQGTAAAVDPLGWWGYLGYGVAAELLAPGDGGWGTRLADPVHADLAMLRVDRAVVFDHATGAIDLVTDDAGAGGSDAAAVRNAWVLELVAWWPGATATPGGDDEPPDPGAPSARAATWADDPAHYRDLVESCRRAIHDGDAYVLCLTTSATVTTAETDLGLYSRLRRQSPAPRASFLRLGDTALLGASPEMFLTVAPGGRTVSTSPIKGTRPRAADAAADAAVAAELAANHKERAENLMIVDLMRNDLSRVSEPGSVDVSELFAVKPYAHVHQLVSTVHGRLRTGLNAVDVLRATFPPGSMTGAPKHRSVDLLADFEAGTRGPYSGVVGRLGFDGAIDLAVAIRTIVLDRATGSARVGVGGGVTEASVAADELAETRLKAAALLDVLGSGGTPPGHDSLI